MRRALLVVVAVLLATAQSPAATLHTGALAPAGARASEYQNVLGDGTLEAWERKSITSPHVDILKGKRIVMPKGVSTAKAETVLRTANATLDPLPEFEGLLPRPSTSRKSRGPTTPSSPLGYTVCAVPANVCARADSLNMPVLLDVDGIIGPDLQARATFAPAAGAQVPDPERPAEFLFAGATFSLDVTRLPGPGGLPYKALKQHVFAVFDVGVPKRLTNEPAQLRRIAVGFDGSKDTLSDSTTMTFTVLYGLTPNPDESIALSVAASISHSNPGKKWALTFGVGDPQSDATTIGNPVRGALSFDPVVSYSGQVDLRIDDNGVETVYKGTPLYGLRLNATTDSGIDVNLSLSNLPTDIRVVLDSKKKNLKYVAIEPIDRITLTGRFPAQGRVWTAVVDVQGIPAAWSVDFADGVLFRTGVAEPPAPSGLKVKSFSVFVTNLRDAPVPPDGNHLLVDVDACEQGVVDKPGGCGPDVTLSFRVDDIEWVQFEKQEAGMHAMFRVGGNKPLTIDIDLVLYPNRVGLDLVLSNVPTQIDVTQNDDKTEILTSENIDSVRIDVVAGNVAAIENAPNPPEVHGVSVRDGWGTTQVNVGNGSIVPREGWAVKVHVYLTGLPTTVRFTPHTGVLELLNFAPHANLPAPCPASASHACLAVDADIANLKIDGTQVPRVVLKIRQDGIPSSGVDIRIGGVTSSSTATEKTTEITAYKITYTGTDTLVNLGGFHLDLTVPSFTHDGVTLFMNVTLDTSNIPGLVGFQMRQAANDEKATTKVTLVQKPKGIDWIDFKLRLTAAVSPITANVSLDIHLGNIPQIVGFEFGSKKVSPELTLPFFEYAACNTAPGHSCGAKDPAFSAPYQCVDCDAHAGTLDVLVHVQPTIEANLPNVSARLKVDLRMEIVDLGETTTAGYDPNPGMLGKVTLTSVPQPTKLIDLHVSALIDAQITAGSEYRIASGDAYKEPHNYNPNCIPECRIQGTPGTAEYVNGDDPGWRLEYDGGRCYGTMCEGSPQKGETRKPLRVAITFTIDDFGFRLTDVSRFDLTPGIVSAVEGSYGSFGFGWDEISLRLRIDAYVEAVKTKGVLDRAAVKVADIHTDTTYTFDVAWHLATDHRDFYKSYCLPGGVGCLDVFLQPHPHFYSYNKFTVQHPSVSPVRTVFDGDGNGSPHYDVLRLWKRGDGTQALKPHHSSQPEPAWLPIGNSGVANWGHEGNAWLITPDPEDIIPDEIVHIAGCFLSPLPSNCGVSARL